MHAPPIQNFRSARPRRTVQEPFFHYKCYATSMRAFEDIPNEILLQIVRDVQSSDQLSLSLTSQRLHSIAEPHLYRRVTLADSRPWTESEHKLQKFLRTIISRPELGAITRHLDILWYSFFDDDPSFLCTQRSFNEDKNYLHP